MGSVDDKSVSMSRSASILDEKRRSISIERCESVHDINRHELMDQSLKRIRVCNLFCVKMELSF